MRWLRWLAVVAMFAIGVGAVFVSTVGLGGTEAAATEYLTQVARRTDVTKTSAATGTVTSAASYSLAFGEEASIADSSSTASGAETSWKVSDVLVSVGDRVTAGQTLAIAVTEDIERELAAATASLERARIVESEAQKTLDGMRAEVRRQLTDARSAVDAARLSLKNAKVQRADAADGNPKRQARVAVTRRRTCSAGRSAPATTSRRG